MRFFLCLKFGWFLVPVEERLQYCCRHYVSLQRRDVGMIVDEILRSNRQSLVLTFFHISVKLISGRKQLDIRFRAAFPKWPDPRIYVTRAAKLLHSVKSAPVPHYKSRGQKLYETEEVAVLPNQSLHSQSGFQRLRNYGPRHLLCCPVRDGQFDVGNAKLTWQLMMDVVFLSIISTQQICYICRFPVSLQFKPNFLQILAQNKEKLALFRIIIMKLKFLQNTQNFSVFSSQKYVSQYNYNILNSIISVQSILGFNKYENFDCDIYCQLEVEQNLI
ncbi:Hypothetical_protein [Hexamita inflata]|uniref:Hypothetical_protein n=2 Tax=Hexamita inflata TaxID=28002 RepID=A0AA86R957_9EUKA|nr:Hypothetical protein HINF_LOCUS57311 [Hexamita inflata]